MRDDLLWAYDESKAKGKTLETILQEQFAATQEEAGSGREISSHTVGGQTVSFFRSGGQRSQNPEERRESWGNLRRLHITVVAALDESATDADIWAEMDYRLDCGRECTTDYASLRCA